MILTTLGVAPSPGDDRGSRGDSGGVGITAIIGIVIGLLLGIIIVLVVSVILFVLRLKKQKTNALKQQQNESEEPLATISYDEYTPVNTTERNEAYMTNANVFPLSQNEAGIEPFEMTGNNAYSTVITTERNEAYIDTIPAARNMAYGAVATALEDGNSLNREDMNDSYAYVR